MGPGSKWILELVLFWACGGPHCRIHKKHSPSSTSACAVSCLIINQLDHRKTATEAVGVFRVHLKHVQNDHVDSVDSTSNTPDSACGLC